MFPFHLFSSRRRFRMPLGLLARYAAWVFLVAPWAPLMPSAVAQDPKAALGDSLVYSKPDGETFFALGFQIEVPRASEEPREVVIIVDTSASQIGLLRQKSLETLDEFLRQLRPRDLVQILAIDIDAVQLTEEFSGPQSPGVIQAIAKLKKRTPLGATDIPLAIDAAVALFDKRKPAPRAAIFLGDGMSKANLLTHDLLAKQCAKLTEAKLPWSALAIGPNLDTALLGALANHSGGVVAVEYGEVPANKYGQFLAFAVHAEVFWPTKVKLPPQVVEAFPTQTPPLRTDRDSVLVGRGKFDKPWRVEMTVAAWNNHPTTIAWTIEPKASDDVNSYLVELVTNSRKHQGLGLPLAGSQGLVEARLALNADLRKMIFLGRQALSMNNLEQAEQLGKKALDIDGSSPDAMQLLGAIEQKWISEAKKAIDGKQFAQAAQMLLKALEIDPTNEDARKLLDGLPKVGGQAPQLPPPAQAEPGGDLIIKKPGAKPQPK